MADEPSPPAPRAPLSAPLLYLTVLVIATSGLVYELLAGALASYVLGDSVTQFSTTIGVYLFAMGLGSYASRFVGEDVARRFLEVELACALIGGTSAPVLFFAFAYADSFAVVLYGLLLVIGCLVGLEIPLLMRILREQLDFRELVARVLTFDYVGALVASLLFALVLVPELGLTRTSLVFGLLNAGVAIAGTRILRPVLTPGDVWRVRVGGVLIAALLAAGLVRADALQVVNEQALYADPVVFAEQSPYQRLVVTRSRSGGTQLFLNGNLQFASADEYRYHEALVHPAFAALAERGLEARRVLVLGGGDGLAVREILRYPSVEAVVLVDLDPAVTELARRLPALRALNGGSLDDARVEVVHDDAMVWLDEGGAEAPFDVAIVDFPDPNNFSLGKLYTRRFYGLLAPALRPEGVAAVQSTSPLYARRSFWCIDATLRAAGLWTRPYHAAVPSFGEWGFSLVSPRPLDPPAALAPSLAGELRYLDAATLAGLFDFPRDMGPDPTPAAPNRLDEQRLVRLYEREMSRW
ncbi:MAG: polyamine aminopropyltransferase [Myxococcota bacterium]